MSKYSNETRKARYELRNETEQSIKSLGIDRANFHEVGKLEYKQVIKRFYYTFFDYKNRPNVPYEQLDYLWLNFREDLQHSKSIPYGFGNNDWTGFIARIDEIIPAENRPAEFYMINDCGWVYEGKLPEIIRVLENCSVLLEDFYILPKQERFDWTLCYCGDGDCMVLYTRN